MAMENVPMEGPEHRIRRAQDVLHRWESEPGVLARVERMEGQELLDLLVDVTNMSREVIKANRMLESRPATEVMALDQVMGSGVVPGTGGQGTAPGKGGEMALDPKTLPGRLIIRAEDGHPARNGKPGRKGSGFRLLKEGDDLVVQVVSPIDEAVLNDLDVRNIVATEMARLLLGQVLVSENSSLLMEARRNAELVRKYDEELSRVQKLVGELDAQRKEAGLNAEKWKNDCQEWAADYLKLARALGVSEEVRDRSVVQKAEKVAAELFATNREMSQLERQNMFELVKKLVLSELDAWGSRTVSVENFRAAFASRLEALKGGA